MAARSTSLTGFRVCLRRVSSPLFSRLRSRQKHDERIRSIPFDPQRSLTREGNQHGLDACRAGWIARRIPNTMNALVVKLNATGDVVRTTTLLRRLEGEIT